MMNDSFTSIIEGARFDGLDDLSISVRMKEIFDADQAARQVADITKIDWAIVGKEDQLRRSEVMGYLRQGKVKTPDDLYYAAMVFQHSESSDDFKLASLLAERAMNAGREPARFLYADAVDRFLMSQGKPQKFGTQFRFNDDGSSYLYPVDPETTDEERAKYLVPPLEQMKKMLEEFNARHRG